MEGRSKVMKTRPKSYKASKNPHRTHFEARKNRANLISGATAGPSLILQLPFISYFIFLVNGPRIPRETVMIARINCHIGSYRVVAGIGALAPAAPARRLSRPLASP